MFRGQLDRLQSELLELNDTLEQLKLETKAVRDSLEAQERQRLNMADEIERLKEEERRRKESWWNACVIL